MAKAFLYNGNVQTKLIEAVNDVTNLSTEFRLEPNQMYISGLRLANVGLYGVDVKYNRVVGAYGAIQKIVLSDGGKQLDAIDNFPLWMAFKAYNKSNKTNLDLDSVLSCSDMGNYIIENDNSSGQIVPWNPVARDMKAEEADTSKGWLDLNCLPFLKNMKFIDTSLFKNLTLTIYYNSNYDQMIAKTTTTTTKSTRPFMIADVILSDPNNSIPKYKGHSYDSVESDVVNIPKPATMPTSVSILQKKSEKVNGFNNKTIKRMMIMKVPLDSVVYKDATSKANTRTGSLCSVTNVNEKLQVYVDGKSLFPQSVDGLTKPNQRLKYLHDSWGECSSFPFLNDLAYDTNAQATLRDSFPDGNKMISMMDVYGFDVYKTPISEITLDFSRENIFVEKTTGGTVASDVLTENCISNIAQNMYIFAEVPRDIVLDGNGSYNVVYG